MKHVLRRGAAVVACALAAALLAGCGTVGGSANSAGKKPLVIGFSFPYLKDQFQVAVLDAAVKDAKAQGIKTLQPADANDDAGLQVTQVRNLIAAGATGIIISPRDTTAIVPAIQYAASHKVPVVMALQPATSGPAYLAVASSFLQQGEQDCQGLGKQIGGKGTVLELQGDLATVAGKDRSSGFQDCMKKTYPAVKIISRPTKWEADVAGGATSTTLTSNPDIAGIYMASDTAMGSAVLSALKHAGKLHPAGQPGHIPLYGIDGGNVALDAIRAGTMDGTVSQPALDYAQYSVKALVAAAAGTKVKAGPTDHNSTIISCCGGQSYWDQVPGDFVTKQNVNDSKLWANR